MRFGADDVEALGLGSAVLGTGGGGDPYLGTLSLRTWLARGYEPEIVSADMLADDAFVVPVAMLGSPAVGLEKLGSLSQPVDIMARVAALANRKVDALIAAEIGGINSLLPLMCACAGQVPVIDGDGIGRAFPTIDRTTFNLAGVPLCPAILVNERGECVTIDVTTTERAETVARLIATEFGGAIISALYTMTGRQAKEGAVHGTLSLAMRIGHAILDARAARANPFEALFAALSTHDRPIAGGVIFDGKVADLERRMNDGYNTGHGTVEGLAAYQGQTATFTFQNEYLVVYRNGEVAAVVPDLIAFLDRETAQPITCETVRYGQRLRIVAFEADPIWHGGAGLKRAGPASFGIAQPFVPLKNLLARRERMSSEGDVPPSPPA